MAHAARLVGGGGDSGASSWGVGDHESLIALYLQTVLWPLFDNDLRQLKALKSSWTAPQRVLDAWEADVQEPHLIWTPDVRCDARVVASAEAAVVTRVAWWLVLQGGHPAVLEGRLGDACDVLQQAPTQ